MALQTERLERETEEVRADLSHTLDELRQRMTPGYLVDQAIDYAREGEAAAFVSNLRRQVVDNPLALGLIGAGVAWLMMPPRARDGAGAEHLTSQHFATSDRSGQPGYSGQFEDTGEGMGDRIKDASGRVIGAGSAAGDRLKGAASAGADRLSDAGRYASDRVSAAGEQISGTASSAAQSVSDSYGRLSDSVSEGYGRLSHGAGDAATRARHSISSMSRSITGTTSSASRNFMQTCREQPLILAGLGLAIGAAIGVCPSEE